VKFFLGCLLWQTKVQKFHICAVRELYAPQRQRLGEKIMSQKKLILPANGKEAKDKQKIEGGSALPKVASQHLVQRGNFLFSQTVYSDGSMSLRSISKPLISEQG